MSFSPNPSRLSVAAALGLAASMWILLFHIWAPGVDPGRFSDLYPRWYGARELLLHQRDPYSAPVTREIQIWLNGKPGQIRDECRFAYPPYVAFLLAPTLLGSFDAARREIGVVLVLLTVASALIWLRALRWRPPPATLAVVLILTFFNFPVLYALYAQQLVLVVSFCVAAAMLCLVRGHLATAGPLLAIATIKPQVTVPLIAWVVLWSISDWSRRRFTVGFLAAMAALAGGSFLVLPNWVREFSEGVFAYTRYTDARSVLELLLGRAAAKLMSAAIIAGVAFVCWRMRLVAAESRAFLTSSALVLSTTLAIIPTLAAHGQVLLLPAAMLLVCDFREFWSLGRSARHAYVAAWALLAWQWIAALVLALARIRVPAERLQTAWPLAFGTSPLVPVGMSVVLAYAVVRMLPGRQSEGAQEVAPGAA